MAGSFYRVIAEDGLTIQDEKGKEHRLAHGRVVSRDVLLAHPDAQITWLLDQHLVKDVTPEVTIKAEDRATPAIRKAADALGEADAPDSEQPHSSRAGRAVSSAPPAPAPTPDDEEAD